MGPSAFQALRCPQIAHDVAEAATHLGVLILQDVESVGELVAGVAPCAVVPGFLVAAVFAIQEHELRGGGGGELAEPTGDERCLAVAGQARDADAGEPAQREIPVVAEVVTADVQHGRPVGFEGARRAAFRAERLRERIGP